MGEQVNKKSEDPVVEEDTSPFVNRHFARLRTFARENTWDTVIYALLLIGLILTFINTFWGSAIVGIVAGFCYHQEILDWLNGLKSRMDRKDTLSFLVLAVLFILFFVSYPLLFISAAVVVALFQLSTVVLKKK